MALINCPECDKKISDAAAACPECAYPINGKQSGKRVQTIEQTGKQWKLGQLGGGLMIIFGIFSFMVNAGSSEPSSTGALLLFFGLIVYVGSKFGAWWHHH